MAVPLIPDLIKAELSVSEVLVPCISIWTKNTFLVPALMLSCRYLMKSTGRAQEHRLSHLDYVAHEQRPTLCLGGGRTRRCWSFPDILESRPQTNVLSHLGVPLIRDLVHQTRSRSPRAPDVCIVYVSNVRTRTRTRITLRYLSTMAELSRLRSPFWWECPTRASVCLVIRERTVTQYRAPRCACSSTRFHLQ